MNLQITRAFFMLDLETTSKNPDEARIMELGFQMFMPDKGMIKEYRTFIKPMVPIPPDALETHGITQEMVDSCRVCGKLEVNHQEDMSHIFKPWPEFKDIAISTQYGFQNCDFGGKDVRYDLRVLQAEFNREHVEWGYKDARVIDAARLEQLGEPRTLSDLYMKHLGKRLEGAHSALVDVKATIEIVDQQLLKYTTLPNTLEELHKLQWPNWIDTEGKFRFSNDGIPLVAFGKYRFQPMKDVPDSYWWFIINKDFSPEIKEIANQALNHQFPIRSE